MSVCYFVVFVLHRTWLFQNSFCWLLALFWADTADGEPGLIHSGLRLHYFFTVLLCTGQGIDRLTQSALLFWKKKNGDGKLKEEGKKSVFHRGTLEETFRSQGCDAPRGVSQDLTGEVSAGVARGFRDQPCGHVKEENGAQAQLSTTEVPGAGKRPHLIRDMITSVHKPTAPQSWGSP